MDGGDRISSLQVSVLFLREAGSLYPATPSVLLGVSCSRRHAILKAPHPSARVMRGRCPPARPSNGGTLVHCGVLIGHGPGQGAGGQQRKELHVATGDERHAAQQYPVSRLTRIAVVSSSQSPPSSQSSRPSRPPRPMMRGDVLIHEPDPPPEFSRRRSPRVHGVAHTLQIVVTQV